MFCTTLRQRPGLSGLPAQLVGQLKLKESKLQTHDVLVPVTGHPLAGENRLSRTRTIRFLVLCSADLSVDTATKSTEARLARFAALTGGIDVAICFVLSTGSTYSKGQESPDAPELDGLRGYAKLQCLLLEGGCASRLPVLLANDVPDVPDVIDKHAKACTVVHPEPALKHPIDLVRRCTAGDQMTQRQASLTTDYFGSLAELARASRAVERHIESADRDIPPTAEERDLMQSFEGLSSELGNTVAGDIYRFWAE